MFNNIKKSALIVAILGATLTVVLFSGLLFGQDRDPVGGRGYYSMRGWEDPQWNSNIPEKYWLSAEQRSKLKEIRSSYYDEIFPLQRELRALRMEARGYASRPDAEVGKIKSYRKQINDLEEKIEDLRLQAAADINKTLTKEQRGYYGSNYNWLDSDWNHMGRGMMRNMGCCMMGETEMQDMCPMMSDRRR